MADDKTEEPTPKRIQDARKKGQVWKSKDLTAVFAYLVAMGVLKSTWTSFEAGATDLFHFAFDTIARPGNMEDAIPQAIALGMRTIVMMSLPLVAAAAVAGALVEFLIVGPLFTQEPLTPKLEKLNPLPGIKNMFSKRSLVELIKSLAKIVIAGFVVYGVVRDALPEVVLSLRTDAGGVKTVLGELIFRISVRVGLLFIVFALIDVFMQRREYMKQMRMSKEEVKREYKESEGDPHHKAKRKEMAMELLESAQLDAVKGADVIVTNPDHVAVALRYSPEVHGAPVVVCKGLDGRAEAIKALAREHGVPVMRNVPLAHSLVALDPGVEIPEGLYDGVAEVLNFVYGLAYSPARPWPTTRPSPSR